MTGDKGATDTDTTGFPGCPCISAASARTCGRTIYSGSSLEAGKGHSQRSKGELHASWVLEGRAMQDLFIFPRRADRKSSVPTRGDRYATTIRTYDRTLQAWRVNFVNPAAEETSAQLIACRNGEGIKMEGKLSDGTPIRWRYVNIEPTSFHYTAERRCNEDTWQLYLELFGIRSGS
jgi:hypothetical protein